MSKLKLGGKGKFIFRKLLKLLTSNLEEIPDTRQSHKIKYTLVDTYLSVFAMFYLQDPSLLEFQRQIQEKIQINNLKTIFGIQNIPSDTQIRTIIDSHSYDHILTAFKSLFSLLQRGKKLEPFRFLKTRYLITIDGSEYFRSERINCQKCLRKKGESGNKHFYHQMVQATLVHPDLREVIPLAPEFIRNSDGMSKQDCELNAGKRMVKKIKKDHKMLPIIIVADSPYKNIIGNQYY